MKRTYWINTEGSKRFLFSLTESVPDSIISSMYKVKQTNWFVYKLFDSTKINLLAKDKFAWLRKK